MIAHSSSTFNQGFLGKNPEGEGMRHFDILLKSYKLDYTQSNTDMSIIGRY